MEIDCKGKKEKKRKEKKQYTKNNQTETKKEEEEMRRKAYICERRQTAISDADKHVSCLFHGSRVQNKKAM